ncbi:adenosylmethionine-8-amino-7-oxononanoate aminotransferase [Streptomyces zagrosensis]|uniref:Adenosylmethionine-8-amino-7-oxononanoate aminotransferase n=1 Tax=Streptomyces zagrosensis TaxID=1042984 RepID=A0A7W9Q9D2_9ACTN|nr:adenosylmethionine-8-amino-7-oxononanoate aminotransferase [Streptomyces zagrosensis]
MRCHELTGNRTKYKVISRAVAYRGLPQGALFFTGLPTLRHHPRTAGSVLRAPCSVLRAPCSVLRQRQCARGW